MLISFYTLCKFVIPCNSSNILKYLGFLMEIIIKYSPDVFGPMSQFLDGIKPEITS